MNSREYWRKRETEQLKYYILEESVYQKDLKEIYAYMMDQIQKEINGFYAKYAKKEGITLPEARKRVSKLDIEAYGRKAAKYVKEKDFSKEANEEMRLYNVTMKINRLEMLKANIGLELADGFNDLQKYFDRILNKRTLDEFTRQAGILGNTILDNAKAAESIVNASFHNAKFSDRIWLYQGMLKAELDKLLRQGLIQGKHPRELSRHLVKLFGISAYNAERLMRTELARVQTEAQKQSFERNGYEEYEFIALGLSACEVCRELDGKHFKIKNMMPGENAPPMHPNCRCSTSAYMDRDEFERWPGEKDDKKENGAKDVTQEYIKMARPKEGKIAQEQGFNVALHADEIKTAQWIHDNLGGDILLLNESNITHEKTADYLWKNRLWDLKSTSSEKSANSAIRHGLQQIRSNPGGVILNFGNRKISMDQLQDVIDKRMQWNRMTEDIDIIVIAEEKLQKVLRY